MTTIGGILTAIGIAASQVPSIPEEYRWIPALLGAAGAVMLGGTAKDFNTHSTVKEVETATVEKKEAEGK